MSTQRVVVDHYGGPEVLGLVEEDDPRPGPGEVLVKVCLLFPYMTARPPLATVPRSRRSA